MFKITTVIAAITAGIPVVAAATEPTAQEAIQSKSVDVMQGYIVGVGEGLSWANAHLMALKQPPIYCQPSHLGMISYELNASPAGMVLLLALEDTFPCKRTPSAG